MAEPMVNLPVSEKVPDLSHEDLNNPVLETIGALRTYDALQPLHPDRYWIDTPDIVHAPDVINPQGIPVEVEFDKKRKRMAITIGERAMDEYVSGYVVDESPQIQRDLLQLFVGYSLVHDLTIRSLSPDKADAFIEHITKPNGLYNELLGSGLLDDSDNDSLVREYLVGDEDRIAKVNVARFAVGAVCEAMSVADKSFRRRITHMFRPELEQFLQNGKNYRQMAQDVFDQSPERATEMLVEHVKDFDLAAAFPKNGLEVRDFIQIYAEV